MIQVQVSLRRAFIAAVSVAALMAAPANATAINFDIKNGAATVATGSFTYSSANPILSYGDLDTFSLTIGASNYDLSFVTDPSRSINTYFQFETASSAFLHAGVPSLFNIDTQLASMADNFGDGFIFFFQPGLQVYTYDGGGVGQNYQPWTSIEVTPATSVPEPASLALLASGLLAAGAARRKRKAKA
jgi:hypothetical protein